MAILNLLHRGRFRWAVQRLVCGLVLVGAFVPVRAADSHEVQAVFLLHLSRFIRWPDTAFGAPDAPFVIGVLPNEALANVLAEVADGETTGTHPIVVRTVRTTEDLRNCQILYVSKTDPHELVRLVGEVRSKSVLTVSDADGFLRLGGHVQLQRSRGQFKLRLNVAALRRAELSPSASLLRVAEIVGE